MDFHDKYSYATKKGNAEAGNRNAFALSNQLKYFMTTRFRWTDMGVFFFFSFVPMEETCTYQELQRIKKSIGVPP